MRNTGHKLFINQYFLQGNSMNDWIILKYLINQSSLKIYFCQLMIIVKLFVYI